MFHEQRIVLALATAAASGLHHVFANFQASFARKSPGHRFPPISGIPFRAVWFVLVFLACTSSVESQSSPKSPSEHDAQVPTQPQGANRCVVCHSSEVNGYASSAMAHSLRRAGPEPNGTVEAHGTKVTMHSSADGSWQRWENGSDRNEYHIRYVVGSGNHASGYFVVIGGHLFQSPVAFYKSRQSYDLAPGYEHQPDPDFTRPVSEECVLCHSGTSLHVAGTLNEYRSPVFPAEGITCERCHGPVEKHLSDPRSGTIVNPAKLTPAARDSVCEQCHLFGAARVPNPGKKLSDFVPGQPLEDTFTVYRNSVPAGSPAGAFKVISHVEQLALSACSRNSAGRLWCGTCHNPHGKPAEPVEFYRSKCLSCHTANFPASHPARDTDCLNCHMPKRDAKDGGHTAFTDHRIERRPEISPDGPPSAGITAWREPAPGLEKRNAGIANIDVGMQRHSTALVIQGYRSLTEVQRQFAEDPDFFKWIGEALLLGKKTEDAKFAFERALQLDPNSALTAASAASPYIQEGDSAKAIVHLERAITLDPLNLPASTTLIRLYQEQGKLAEAAGLSAKIRSEMREKSDGSENTNGDSANNAVNNNRDVFKNLQVLESIPSRQLIPAMQFMASSLGVECSFCHVAGHFDKDDKEPKQTARKMIQMTLALNQVNFAGQREITCYSCHRGARIPEAVPHPDHESKPNAASGDSEMQTLSSALPTAEQLIQKYIEALGGAEAIERNTSRVEIGTVNQQEQFFKVEVFTQAPQKQTIIYHLASGDRLTAFDGHTGWLASPGRLAREMRDSELESARLDADLQFPLHLQQACPEQHVEYPEKIREQQTNVLVCIHEGHVSAKLYFDKQSNLLVRQVRYADSPLGLNVNQIDYADYRSVDSLQVPFRVTVSQPGSVSRVQMQEIRQNVPIDESRFAKPAPNP